MACHNRRDLTVNCLRNLASQKVDGFTIHATVVDDGSSDGTAAAIRAEFPFASVIHGTGSLYWAASMALAEQESRRLHPDFYLWLNDDTFLDPDALMTLLETNSHFPDAIIVGATRDPVSQERTYGGRNQIGKHPQKLVPAGVRDEVFEVDAFEGNIVLVPASASKTIGPIDGKYAHSYADDDYSMRARKAGVRIIQAPGIIGTCSLNLGVASPDGIRARWRLLQSTKGGLPWRSQMRYMRKHAGAAWPVYFARTYATRLLNIR